jgi:hypothetical protein
VEHGERGAELGEQVRCESVVLADGQEAREGSELGERADEVVGEGEGNEKVLIHEGKGVSFCERYMSRWEKRSMEEGRTEVDDARNILPSGAYGSASSAPISVRPWITIFGPSRTARASVRSSEVKEEGHRREYVRADS